MEDMNLLQYIRGCMKESLRWMPIIVIGAVPHVVTKDDEHMGYLIPKGAGVLNNVYAIHHDPSAFRTQEALTQIAKKNDPQSLYEAESNSDASKQDTFTFGAGRRMCAGMQVAERSLFLSISRMLWAFDISPAVDQTTGKGLHTRSREVDARVRLDAEPYSVAITPRSSEKAERIKYEWKQAQKSLDPKTKQWIEVPKGMVLPSL